MILNGRTSLQMYCYYYHYHYHHHHHHHHDDYYYYYYCRSYSFCCSSSGSARSDKLVLMVLGRVVATGSSRPLLMVNDNELNHKIGSTNSDVHGDGDGDSDGRPGEHRFKAIVITFCEIPVTVFV